MGALNPKRPPPHPSVARPPEARTLSCRAFSTGRRGPVTHREKRAPDPSRITTYRKTPNVSRARHHRIAARGACAGRGGTLSFPRCGRHARSRGRARLPRSQMPLSRSRPHAPGPFGQRRSRTVRPAQPQLWLFIPHPTPKTSRVTLLAERTSATPGSFRNDAFVRPPGLPPHGTARTQPPPQVDPAYPYRSIGGFTLGVNRHPSPSGHRRHTRRSNGPPRRPTARHPRPDRRG